MKVLVVEDELKMASLLVRGFRRNGDAVDVTRTGEDAVWMAAAADYDAIVLDVMLLAEMLDAVATRFRRRAVDAGRTIEVAASTDLVALVDRRRLEQALANLVENALRYGAGTVRLEAAVHSGALVLHVTDQGQGFPPDFLDRAFDRFSRADGSRAGAGLGLAIVAAIAQAHGGTAAASNAASGGADVELTVPGGTRHA